MPEPTFEEEEAAEAAEAPVPLFQCDDCGNFWDGAAQCLCGGWGLEEEENSESGYESNWREIEFVQKIEKYLKQQEKSIK